MITWIPLGLYYPVILLFWSFMDREFLIVKLYKSSEHPRMAGNIYVRYSERPRGLYYSVRKEL